MERESGAGLEITDAVDEFCYDVAQALRRLLGLNIPDILADDEVEEEEDV